jgi:hypothetical protein
MKLTKIIPSHRKTIYALWCRKDFMLFGVFKQAREKYGMSVQSTCFWCRHPFEPETKMALACIKEHGNKLLCEKCADELLASKEEATR